MKTAFVIVFSFLLISVNALEIYTLDTSNVGLTEEYGSLNQTVNLAPNLSFEDGVIIPDGWNHSEYDDGTRFLWDTDFSKSGSLSVGIVNVSSPYTQYYWRTIQLIPVNSARNYVFSVWYKWIGVPEYLQSAQIGIDEYDEHGISLGTGFGKVLHYYDDENWHHGQLNCTQTKFNPSTAYVRLILEHTLVENRSDAQIRFDDAHFSLKSIIVPDDYPTIQEAIDKANEGDTIFVKAGTYNNHVFIDKRLTIVGENKTTTIIHGLGLELWYDHQPPFWGLVTIEASNATIRGFTIQDSDRIDMGIVIRDSYHCNTTDNIIANHRYGIDVRHSSNNFIGNNIISNCSVYGITIHENSKNNILRYNSLMNNDYDLGVFSYYFHEIDSSNTVNGNPIYYWVNQKDKQIPSDAGFVALVNSTNIIVKNITITHNQGILLAYTTNSTIENVKVSNIVRGLHLYHSHNNIIDKCITTNTIEGIRFEASNDNRITGNTIANYSDFGIMLENSQRNTIENNTISIDWIYSSSFCIDNSNDNLIYHNNIFHRYDRGVFMPSPSHNQWDNGYPSGGNYWSDYNGTDLYSGPYQNITGSDGIGDTPHTIDENNIDNYPLIQPHYGPVRNLNTGQSYSTIQGAINNATEGDSILAFSGTYYENVVVNKTVSLVGENITSTVVDGTIYVRANNVEIEEFWLESGQGIWVEDVTGCKISKIISRNSSNFGILLLNTSNSQITYNEIYSNYYDGICLDDESNNNTISFNYIYWFQRDGIGVYQSVFNTIEGNKIWSGYVGLHIRYASSNTVKSNTIMNCFTGICMEHSHNNILYHNSFINNTIETSLPDSESNTWDNGCQGNYWSDYNGTDPDNDGIGDTELPWEGVDYYPLMNLYWNPADVDHDLDVDLYDAVRLLLTYSSTPEDERYNCHCDIAEPHGIIDLYDAVLLLVNYGKKYS